MHLTRTFMRNNKTLLIFSVWLISGYIVSLFFKTEMTAQLSVKMKSKEINSLEEILDYGLNSVLCNLFVGIVSAYNNKNPKLNILKKIYNKSVHDHLLIPINELISNKRWVVDVSYGRGVIFHYGIPLKQMVILHEKHLRPNTKFRFLDLTYDNPMMLTIVSNYRLSHNFRTQLNLRYI